MTLREFLAALFKPKPKPVPVPKPVITLVASKLEFKDGESVTVRWAITGADSARARQDTGPWLNVPAMSGTSVLTPKATTKFFIEATNKSGTSDTMLTLLRKPFPGGGTVAASFSVSPDKTAASLTTNGTDTITLTISRLGGHATTVNISDSGLPTGVTASYPDGSSWTTSATGTRRVVLTGSSAPNVSLDAFTITSTDGVAPDVESCTCTVTSASGFAANRPSGLTTLHSGTNIDMSAGQISTASGSSNWRFGAGDATSGQRSITGVGGAPYATTCIEEYYTDNAPGVGGSWITSAAAGGGPATGNYKEIYFAMACWFSSDYVMHSGDEKFFYPYVYTANAPSIVAGPLLELGCDSELGETPNGGAFGFRFLPNLALTSLPKNYSLPAWKGGGSYTTIYPSDSSKRIARGTWFDVELRCVMNTGSNSDGIVQLWHDGTLILNRSDILYANDGSQGYFDSIRFDGTRGGGSSSVNIPVDGQERRYNYAQYAAKT